MEVHETRLMDRLRISIWGDIKPLIEKDEEVYIIENDYILSESEKYINIHYLSMPIYIAILLLICFIYPSGCNIIIFISGTIFIFFFFLILGLKEQRVAVTSRGIYPNYKPLSVAIKKGYFMIPYDEIAFVMGTWHPVVFKIFLKSGRVVKTPLPGNEDIPRFKEVLKKHGIKYIKWRGKR